MTMPSEIEEYINILDDKIHRIFQRKQKKFIEDEHRDILDDGSNHTIEQIKEEYKRKKRTMKYGEVWQVAMGNFPGWENLGNGHESKCDVRKKDNSAIIELKNRYNTVNSGGKSELERKLSAYKEKNPDTECIWGVINTQKRNTGSYTQYEANGQLITKRQGSNLLSFVFTYEGRDYSQEVIDKLKSIVSQY